MILPWHTAAFQLPKSGRKRRLHSEIQSPATVPCSSSCSSTPLPFASPHLELSLLHCAAAAAAPLPSTLRSPLLPLPSLSWSVQCSSWLIRPVLLTHPTTLCLATQQLVGVLSRHFVVDVAHVLRFFVKFLRIEVSVLKILEILHHQLNLPWKKAA